MKVKLPARGIFTVTTVKWSWANLNSPAYRKTLSFFFLPLNVPVALLKVPRDARGCGEAAWTGLDSIPPPRLSTHMFMRRWAWHAQAFISLSVETLIWPAAACKPSILEFLKGVVKVYEFQVLWEDMTPSPTEMYISPVKHFIEKFRGPLNPSYFCCYLQYLWV